MRYLVAIVFFTTCVVSSHAQSGAGLVNTSTSISDTLKLPDQSKLDSLKALGGNHIDSLNQIQQRIARTNKADSLRNALADQGNKLKHRLSSINSGNDSLVNLSGGVIDRLQNRISHATDSLSGNATGSVAGISSSTNKATEKIANAEDKINNTLESSASKAEDAINSATGKSVSLDKKIDLDSKLPGTSLPEVNHKLNVPGVGSKDISINAPEIGGVEIPRDGVGDLSKELKLSETTSLPDIKDISGEAGNVTEGMGELNKYELELKKAQEAGVADLNGMDKMAEEKAAEYTGLKDMHPDAGKLTAGKGQYDAMIAKYSDKKALQQEVVRKAANVANDLLAKHAGAFQKARVDVSKAKSSVGKVKTLRDVFKRKSDVLEKMKFHERLIPGITVQLYNRDVVAVDFGAQLGYRITPSLTVGVGGIYRAGFSDDYDHFVSSEGVYGWRTYAELTVIKGIFLHGEFEALSISVDKFPATIDVRSDHVYGSYFGLGKKFNVSRYFKMSTMALYRLEYDGSLPSMNKINVRIGVEYTWKKKRKLEDLRLRN